MAKMAPVAEGQSGIVVFSLSAVADWMILSEIILDQTDCGNVPVSPRAQILPDVPNPMQATPAFPRCPRQLTLSCNLTRVFSYAEERHQSLQ